MTIAPAFKTETDLCATFIEAIGEKWTAYAETAGWDILLVRTIDGFQIGVEAKLRLNSLVLSQALEDRWSYHRETGPDCRAVLVPEGRDGGFHAIAAYIGLTIITVRNPDERRYRSAAFTPYLPDLGRFAIDNSDWFEWSPTKRHALPEYVPDVAAGASAPVQLSPWKIKALRIAAILELRGSVTKADFKTLQLDHRRWMAPGNGWLVNTERGWVAGRHLPDFRGQHPKVFAEIIADAEKWMPKDLLTRAA